MILDFENLEEIIDIAKNIFPMKQVFLSIPPEKMENFKNFDDMEILNMFNNHSWEEILTDYDHYTINMLIFNDIFSLFRIFSYIQDKDQEHILEDFIFYSTGLLCIEAVIEAQDPESYRAYNIKWGLDPLHYLDGPYQSFHFDFHHLIDRYSPEQLCFIGQIFNFLEGKVEMSDICIRYWKNVVLNNCCHHST